MKYPVACLVSVVSWISFSRAFTQPPAFKNSVREHLLPTLQGIRFRGGSEQVGTELFRNEGSYVPSGLSREQYDQLKKEEADEIRKMDFGSWGPRFKKGERPDGDWMVMPSLWTNGFNSQPLGVDGMPAETPTLGFLRSQLPAFVLGYITLHTLFAASAIIRMSTLSVRTAALTMLRASLANSPTFKWRALAKTCTTITFLSLFLIPTMHGVLERINRRRLWGPQRTILSAAGAAVGTLSVLSLAVAAIRTLLG